MEMWGHNSCHHLIYLQKTEKTKQNMVTVKK